MKKKLIHASIFVVATILLTSCSVTTPLSVSAAPVGTKKGYSETTILFGAWQLNKNFGLAEAAKKGKITNGIAFADMKTTSYVFFSKKKIIVYGE